MGAKENNAGRLVKVPQQALLSLVANTLKDQVLFPDKLEKAKKYMRKIESAKQ